MSSMRDKNYYEILEVSESASTEEIRHAFQKKARRLHPDVNKDAHAEDEFKEVSEAYAVLSDPQKRSRYDAMRTGNPFAGFAGASGSGADPFGGQGANPFGGFDFSGTGGFPFGGFWSSKNRGAATPAYNPRPGSDVVYNLVLDDATAKKGGKKGITYERFIECNLCHGLGSVETQEIKECPTCHGTGHMEVDLGALFGGQGMASFEVQCPECEGTGKVVADPCPNCNGSGRMLAGCEEVIDIAPKTHNGDERTIPYMGNAGTNNEKAGDLRVRFSVPSEVVAPAASFGFACIGFSLPYFILGFFMSSLAATPTLALFPLILGIFLVARHVIARHNLVWWKNAALCLMRGATNGIIFAAIFTLLISCSTPRTSGLIS